MRWIGGGLRQVLALPHHDVVLKRHGCVVRWGRCDYGDGGFVPRDGLLVVEGEATVQARQAPALETREAHLKRPLLGDPGTIERRHLLVARLGRQVVDPHALASEATVYACHDFISLASPKKACQGSPSRSCEKSCQRSPGTVQRRQKRRGGSAAT